MLKNDYYTIPIDKNIFMKIVESVGVENFNVKLHTTMFFDKENLEFSSVDFQYQYLSLKEIKDSNGSDKYICYTHYYPENEMFNNIEKTYQVKIDNLQDMQNILQAIGFKLINTDIIKEMTIQVLEKYYMNLKVTNEVVYCIEFNTIDNHYITKEDYEEINEYIKKYGITHVENVF